MCASAEAEHIKSVCGWDLSNFITMDDNRLSNAALEPASPDSSDNSSVSATVDYAKSFHLRFAGNSTVRKKQRPKVRKTREDESDDTSTDEEYDIDGEGADLQGGGKENGRDSEEMRMKLSQREWVEK